MTLIEVLVVMAAIMMLLGLLIPGLNRSRQLAVQTACQAGLQQIGVAISTYAMENRGYIPYGPKAPPPSATNFYPLTGDVTSLISLESGAPVGLGLLLSDNLSKAKEVLFCPGADDKWDVQESLKKVGVSQTECSYYYRHASVTKLSGPLPPPQMTLDRLGRNRKGAAVRCLAFDTQFLSTSQMEQFFNITTRTHHKRLLVDALYCDGHVSAHRNTDGRFTVNISMSVYNTLDRILDLFEILDTE